jgi:hypothetical protein
VNQGEKMDKFPVIFGLICGGFFLIITLAAGIALLVYSANSKKKAGASQQWPNTSGTIFVSEVRQSASTDEDGHTSYSYYPHVEYSYTISGQTYTAKQIAFGGVKGFNNSNKAQTILSKYPVNAHVLVFYNPQKPVEAVLERVAGEGAKTAKTIGIILLVISVLIACPLLIGVIRNF